jgi:uncharacterized protein (DUF1810 family)
MIDSRDTIDCSDPFDLCRFTSAQYAVYDRVLAEIRNGLKRTHWMWYIFPQLHGLGHSSISNRYSIKSIEEAQRYLDHPVLGTRLMECVKAALAIEGRSAYEIFGYPDELKFKSSMTLFEYIATPDSIFKHVLDKYFHGERDVVTLQLLAKMLASSG